MDEIRKRTIREWAAQGILGHIIDNLLETLEETEIEDMDDIKNENQTIIRHN